MSHIRKPMKQVCLFCYTLMWLLLCLGLCAGQPSSYRARYYEIKCMDPVTGRELFVGDAFTRNCVRVQCLGDGRIWQDKCQQPKLRGNCTIIPAANEYLDYPDCCPIYECKTYHTNEHGETEETRTYDHYGNLRKTHITQLFVILDPQGRSPPGRVPGSGVKTSFDI